MQVHSALILQLYQVQFFQSIVFKLLPTLSGCRPTLVSVDLVNHTVFSEQGQHCDFNIL